MQPQDFIGVVLNASYARARGMCSLRPFFSPYVFLPLFLSDEKRGEERREDNWLFLAVRAFSSLRPANHSSDYLSLFLPPSPTVVLYLDTSYYWSLLS